MGPDDPREVCFLLGEDEAVLWSDASTSPVAMPDSRERWETIWRLRASIVEIAHTHPLGGAHFSNIDETTMTALDAALGRKLKYSVVTPAEMLQRVPSPNHDSDVDTPLPPTDSIVEAEPWWTQLIRVASGITSNAE